MRTLNTVETKLTVAGNPCHFVHLTLRQAFNHHHTFEIQVDFEELDTIWMENPTKIIQLISQEVSIEMTHKQTGQANFFKGIITNVSMNGRNGEQNFITLLGSSPTILLEGRPSMNSFTDLTLELIAREAVDTSGNEAEVEVKPQFKSTIDYIAQYNENCFEFLNRLSWLYGEWFFYDGSSICFGKPDLEDAESITYDEEMVHFDLSANLIPPNVNRYEYLSHQDNETIASTPDRVEGVRGYIKASLDQSAKVYASESRLALDPVIGSRKDLDDMLKVDKYRSVSQMLTIGGTTKTCKVRIGRLVSVNLPKTMRTSLKHVETFLVTEVIHEADQDGSYINRFRGIPSEMEHIPMQGVKVPTALSQIAWVTSNADAKGRIRVAFQWQKALNKTTNWLRVQTPDAGSSNEVASNRGFVFIPEEGDQVMVNFVNGDPNRPYVSGSLFNENVSRGGQANNAIKSIFTRSGIQIVFNDDEGQGSLHISDPSGNTWDMDGKGNITVNAPNDITLKAANNIHIEAGNNIETQAGADIKTDAMATLHMGSQGNLDITTESDMQLKAMASTSVMAQAQMQIEGATVKATSSSSMEIAGTDTSVKGQKTTLSGSGHKIEII